MSHSKAHHRTGNAVNSVRRRARQVTARLRPAADQVMPLAKTAGAAAKLGADKTRTWAAPQVERAGQVVEDSVAPKVSSVLSAAARRLEPDKPRRPRWRKVVGVSAAAAGVVSAFAAAVRNRAKASAAAASDARAETDSGSSDAQTAPGAEPVVAVEKQDRQ